MKRLIAVLLALLMLAGCAADEKVTISSDVTEKQEQEH